MPEVGRSQYSSSSLAARKRHISDCVPLFVAARPSADLLLLFSSFCRSGTSRPLRSRGRVRALVAEMCYLVFHGIDCSFRSRCLFFRFLIYQR
ncbi:hypothetical protein B296_00009430 [Ensete ventricosum]|uniref:Uncharacterized protein n=1 Tax=Ensete ventricosum TaxID=4639 RepID=A0A426ZKV7_ENSVE|nr:hypothetical protein B296_00009430 [Ensete ventricosum]